jgi:hypothetical protein
MKSLLWVKDLAYIVIFLYDLLIISFKKYSRTNATSNLEDETTADEAAGSSGLAANVRESRQSCYEVAALRL